MFSRVLSAAAVLAALASPAFAAGQTIWVNTSYSLQVPVAGETDTQIVDQEKSLKRSMYERAARECDDLKATIALACQITNISVSTQITRNPGTPSQVYVSANVQMQVTVK
jgi:hypothetical protein